MAKIYLDSNNTEYTISNNNDDVIGLAGAQTVKVASGLSNTVIDQNVEAVVFAGSASDYTYLHAGNSIKVYTAASVLVSTIYLQGDADGTLLTFNNGTASAILTATGDLTLGGAIVDTSAPVHVAPTLDTTGIIPPAVSSFNLTTGQDEIYGTAGADTFAARIFDNSNTLQSGDVVHGGAGYDTLKAYVGNSQNFAILAETDGVEKVQIQAQAVSSDSTDNNTSKTNEVQIDAQLLSGVTYLEDNNSRADLLIEDVRTNSKIVTVAMVGTDPGHVDYGVYFDQHALTNNDTTVAPKLLTLEIMDLKGSNNSGEPLIELPLIGFTARLNNGTTYNFGGSNALGTETSAIADAINNAHTYVDLAAALNAAVAANTTPGANLFHFSVGDHIAPEGTDATGNHYIGSGNYILLSYDNSADPSVGFATLNNNLETSTSSFNFDSNVTTSEFRLNEQIVGDHGQIHDLITTNVVLDDVGRGNMGGDLVIGGLSVGDTDNCVGVEKFLVTVIHDSELQTMNSTNNKLQEVYIVNDATVHGNLTITGNVDSGNHLSASSAVSLIEDLANGFLVKEASLFGGIDNALPGTVVDILTPTNTTGDQHYDGYGLHDLRVVDASTFQGDLNLSAVLTDSVVAKYMDLKDIQVDPAADNAQFLYTLGLGNDKLALDISPDNFNILGTTTREDFVLKIAGGAGDDTIVTSIGSAIDTTPWYINSKLNANLNIDAGTGNDTVNNYGAGDWKINLGDGNDTIYADNSGSRAQWVFNTADQVNPVAAARNINDLVSDTNDKYALYKSNLTVHFMGFEKTVVLPDSGYNVTDLQVNQAIKDAINNDAVLSKMLSAHDGPANTLVVDALSDAVRAAAAPDFYLSVTTPSASTLTATDVTNYAAAHGMAATSTAADVAAAILAVATTGTWFASTTTDYASAHTNNGSDIVGSASLNSSDNHITGGADNDVIVLGTGPTSNDTIIYAGDTINAFGHDSVLNFVQGDGALTVASVNLDVDHIDFSAYLGAAYKEIDLTLSTSAITGNAVINYEAVAATDALNLTGTVDIINNNAIGWFTAVTDTTFDLNDILAPALNAVTDEVFMVERVSATDAGAAANNGVYDVYHYHATNSATAPVETLVLVGSIDFGHELGTGTMV